MIPSTQTFKNLARWPFEWAAACLGAHKTQFYKPHLWVLMYHRILPRNDHRYLLEEPGMIVEPETFEQHIKILKKLFTITPLQEWLHRRKTGEKLPARACAITFDDGWLDNYEYAYPILKQEQVPATIFAVSSMIGTQRQFWPNRANTLLQQPLDKLLEVDWLRPLLINIKALNRETIANLIHQLKEHSDDTLNQWLEDAENQLGHKSEATALMDWDQLREISDSGLIDIGSHTCNHTRLKDNLSEERLVKELQDSKNELQNQLNRSIELFCYPNGDISDQALKLIPTFYEAAVTTANGINTSVVDPFQLKRIAIHEDGSNRYRKFCSKLSGWI